MVENKTMIFKIDNSKWLFVKPVFFLKPVCKLTITHPM